MSSVEEFVRTSILAYPSIFTSRTNVLHHVLCVIGNGYKWSTDGTVVSNTGESIAPWDLETATKRMETYLEDNLPSDLRDLIRPDMMKGVAEEAKIVAEVDNLMYLRTPVEHFYPQSKDYALLMNIPENVTPDWKAACDEMRELAIAAGWVFSE
jgi:hypothetical protein